MKIVPDFIEVTLIAQDANWKIDFVVAFKLLNAPMARLMVKKLLASSYETQVSILLSNIVYVDKVALGSGSLTNSFETAIMKSLLSSLPYFKSILANYVVILQSMGHIQKRSLQEQNLFEIGKFQYELDYGKQDLETKIKEDTKMLQEGLGEFMNFSDEEDVKQLLEVVKEKLTVSTLPDLAWKSNIPYLELFNIAKLYRNEWGIINPVVIIELAKEAKLKISDTLSFISLLFAGYESMKSEK
jgi:hypothetical protein